VPAPGSHGYSVGEVLGPWILFGALPFAFGRALTVRSALTRELGVNAARLEGEQEVRAHAAAGEERSRMARELHDVVAHGVSVMVIQTSAARRVVREDLGAAVTALAAVESAGRDALVELRRIVGVLRRGSDALAGPATPGLSQLGALVDRARASGLPVELRVEGQRALPPGLDLVAYRVVQEGLTNVIKHAGPAPTAVNVNFGADAIELRVSDSGSRPPNGSDEGEQVGHGLIGMKERVALYGGELKAGPRARGGYEVLAQIPLDGRASSSNVQPLSVDGRTAIVAAADEVPWAWLDPLLACLFLAVFEVTVLISNERRGSLALNLLVVGAMALATIWRRRSPVLFALVLAVLVTVMNNALTSLNHLSLAETFFLIVPMYSIAAWAGDRRAAALGLAIYAGGAAITSLLLQHHAVGDFAGAAFILCAAWAAGYAMRARRVLALELRRTSGQLAAEREHRAALAVAGERSRIARELHGAVAHSVAAMVVQAEAARSLVGRDPVQADTVMDAIESTGRQALAEMRRILGVIRHADEVGELEPQPGVAQIYTLIQRARERGQPVELSVDGEPGPLPAGVDLGIYRILDDALNSVPQKSDGVIGVALRFGEDELELRVTARCVGPSEWPTNAMRERVALCGGQLYNEAPDEHGWQFATRMPRRMQGALA
jgi:signal transduction histidine kinase